MKCADQEKCGKPCPIRSGSSCWLRGLNRWQRWALIVVVALLTAILSFGAIADTWVAKNKSGGEIVMTDKACSDSTGKWFAYYYNSDHSSVNGCYTVDGETVHVYWETGRTYVYPMNIFKQQQPFTKDGLSFMPRTLPR